MGMYIYVYTCICIYMYTSGMYMNTRVEKSQNKAKNEVFRGF